MQDSQTHVVHDSRFDAMMRSCALSVKAVALVFYSMLFTRDFDDVLDAIVKILDSPTRQKAICAYRGCGKTTLVLHAYILWSILFGGKRFIVYAGATAELAKEKTEEFKYFITRSPMIKLLFGDVKGDTWSVEGYEIKLGNIVAFILPRGGNSEQPIRGRIRKGNRPDLLIADDMENPKHINNEEQRHKIRRYFANEMMGAVDIHEDYWVLVQIGNRQHQDSMLSRALESEVWESVLLPLCNEKFESLVPETFSDEQVMTLYRRLEADGQAQAFYEEYMQSPIAVGKDAAYTEELFIGYDEKDEKLNQRGHLENILLLDPARTANLKSAESALVVVGFDAVANIAYIRDVVVERFHPEELYKAIGDLVRLYDCRVIGLEVTGLHDFIVHPLQTYLIQERIFVELVECQARGGAANNVSGDDKPKVRRSRWISDWFRRGLFRVSNHVLPYVKGILMSWPKPSKWDFIDALSYLTAVLNTGDRYMNPKAEDDAMESKRTVEREYADLEDTMAEFDYMPLV